MFDILETVNRWLAAEKPVALATVVATWGSAPRAVGAKMAVTADMEMIGSVSGGCVETAVVEAALNVLESGVPQLLSFGVSDEQAWDVGLACGGKIQVWVEALDCAWWQTVTTALADEQPVTSLTLLDGADAGAKLVLDAQNEALYASHSLTGEQTAAFAAASYPASGLASLLERSVLVDVMQPRAHLIIVGGVHIAMALSSFARTLGMRVTLIDPRSAFATPERFPEIAISHQFPAKALANVTLGAGTFLAVLTHDPKIDDPAVIAALNSDAVYIGVLGSQRTHQQRLERLRQHGFGEDALARLHAPIGLSIGAKTPEEIALAIMAQIVEVKNRQV